MEDNILGKIRQVLLDLLEEYQNLDKPTNPELLKIFIELSEDKIQALVEQQVLIGRIEEAKLFNRYFDDNYAFKGFVEQRLAELTQEEEK